MSRKFTFFMLVLFLITCTAAFSQETENEKIQTYDSSVITKINFEGLKRTKESFIQSELEEFLNKNATAETVVQATTKLRFEGLFSEIRVSYKPTGENEVSMEVFVKEKISFLPVPFAMYTSSTGFMGGAVVMDMNAFGVKDMAMVGGFFSPNQISGMLSYTKQPKGWIPGFSTSLSVGKRDTEVTNMDNSTVLEYDSFSVHFSASVNEKIGKYHTVSLGGHFKYLNADKDNKYRSVLLESMTSGGFSVGWKVATAELNSFYTSYTNIGVNAAFTFSNNADFPVSKNFSLRATLQKPLNPLPRLRLCAAVSGHYGIDNPISAYSGREAGNVSILPGKFKTERIFGGQAGAEFAIVKAKFGVISLYANYEAVIAQDFDDSYKFNQGISGGGKLYLSKIAIPALAAGVSFNTTTNTVQFAAAFGMSF